jgi:hypothetical protein
MTMNPGFGGQVYLQTMEGKVAEACRLIAERRKLVDRLGEGTLLPVEVVRFAWPDTRRRLLALVVEATLRLGQDGAPLITDEGNHILDCAVPAGRDLWGAVGGCQGDAGRGRARALSGHGRRGHAGLAGRSCRDALEPARLTTVRRRRGDGR